MCHAHHDHPWSEGGCTDVEHGRLLCPRHHARAHDPRYEMRIGSDNQVTFHRRRRPTPAPGSRAVPQGGMVTATRADQLGIAAQRDRVVHIGCGTAEVRFRRSTSRTAHSYDVNLWLTRWERSAALGA